MPQLLSIPTELLDLVVETLVQTVGIQKAVLLRTTNRVFDAAILRAICDAQVVEMDDPATPRLPLFMSPSLRGKIISVQASTQKSCKAYVLAVGKVNQALDSLLGDTEPTLKASRHGLIAASVLIVNDSPGGAGEEAQNLLSGAACIGNLSLVKSLLRDGTADINGHTPFFHSPLTLAAAQGHYAVVHYLLLNGAETEAVCAHWEETPKLAEQIHWNNQDDLVIRSIALSVDPPSALRSAVEGGFDDIVELLLAPPYRLPTESLEYLRVLSAAATSGRADLIDVILGTIAKSLSDFDGFSDFLLFKAIRYDRRELVERLLDEGVSVNAYGSPCWFFYSSPLGLAAHIGNVRMVRLLLERGANVDYNEWGREEHFPVVAAARCGHEEIIDILLEHGASSTDAFLKAAETSHPRIIKSLLMRYPDLFGREDGAVGCRAFFKAIFSGNLDSIELLVKAGAPLTETTTFDGYIFPVPMQAAKIVGQWVVNHLLLLGAADISDEVSASNSTVRSVKISERTWEWVGKF